MRETKRHYALLALLASTLVAAPFAHSDNCTKGNVALPEGLPADLTKQIEAALAQAFEQAGDAGAGNVSISTKSFVLGPDGKLTEGSDIGQTIAEVISQAGCAGAGSPQITAKCFTLGPDGKLKEGSDLKGLLSGVSGSAHTSVTIVGPDGKVTTSSHSSDSIGGGHMRHHIGVSAMPVAPAVRAQLGLGKNAGLTVISVQPNSPAAAAGVKVHDIILTANDKPVKNVIDLRTAVTAAAKDGSAVSLNLMRGGKKQKLEVTPKEVAPLDMSFMSSLFPNNAKLQEEVKDLRKEVEMLKKELKAKNKPVKPKK